MTSHRSNVAAPATRGPDAAPRRRWLRSVATLVLLAQLALAFQPLSVLAQPPDQPAPLHPHAQAQLQRLGDWNQRLQRARQRAAQEREAPADRAARRLARVQDLADELDPRTRRGVHAPRRPQALRELREQLQPLAQDQAELRAELAAQRDAVRGKALPPEIVQRAEQALADFDTRAQTFRHIAERVQRPATSDAAAEADLADLADFLRRHPAKRRAVLAAPDKMPWRTHPRTPRAPAETQGAWFRQLHGDRRVQLAQAGAWDLGVLRFTHPAAPGAAPEAPDLAPTDEVQITPAIRALAAELGNNPVAIRNWVHNHIDFTPTAGAIQSAQDTLDKRRGNATDTTSLLIALLRAAGIPARYEWGTIELPATRVQNWLGVHRSEAALQLLNQGGIAARGLASGGRLATIRMEHVWARAYVNWIPSRGSMNGTDTQHPNPNAGLNRWVPLDASFKQYDRTQGMDLATQVPLDTQALLDAARRGATVNEAEGWVQHLDSAAVATQLSAWQQRITAHIAASPKGENTTVADVIGRRLIAQQQHGFLTGSWPYQMVQSGGRAAAVPTALQHRFTYRLYASREDMAQERPVLAFDARTAQLVGKRLTLGYVPATPADAELLASLLPTARADGKPLQASDLPASLPGYLLRVKPRLLLDGQVVAEGSQALTLGADLWGVGGFTQLHDTAQWDLSTDESHVAGQATAIGISAGGVSAAQLQALKERLTQAQATLQSGDANAIGALSGEQLSGDLLTAVIWSWFAAGEAHRNLSQGTAGMVEHAGLSYGLFHAKAEAQTSWGVVRKVSFPGVNIDIGHLRTNAWASDHDEAKWVAWNRLRGQHMSALEHAVPEAFFSDPGQCNRVGTTPSNPALPDCPEGVSAVKALAIAAQAGQKVFTITPAVFANHPQIVSQRLSQHSEDTKERVQQALEAGYEVTIHEGPIAVDGWSGAGFTVIDPATGAGGYLIEGQGNGGYLDWWGANGDSVGLALALVSFVAAVATIAAWITATLLAFSVFLVVMNVLSIDLQTRESGCPGLGRLGIGIEIVAFVVGLLGTAGVAISTWMSFVTGGAVGIGVNACRR